MFGSAAILTAGGTLNWLVLGVSAMPEVIIALTMAYPVLYFLVRPHVARSVARRTKSNAYEDVG